MNQLKNLDFLAGEFQSIDASSMGNARKRRDKDNLIFQISRVLSSSVRKIAKAKGMLDIQDEVNQHAFIAINNALTTWNPELSSFSTHVHWQLKAEMRTLELYHFPERRKVSQNIDVKMVYLNRQCGEGEGDVGTEVGDIMNLDPEGFKVIEENVTQQLQKRNIEYALARIVMPDVARYIAGGCVSRSGILAVMRNIHIYTQSKITEENPNLIGEKHGITRERVRQITKVIGESFSRHIKDMLINPRALSEEEKDGWELALSIYREEKKQCPSVLGLEISRTSEEIEDAFLQCDEAEMRTKLSMMVAGLSLAAIGIPDDAAVAQEKSRAIPPVIQKIKVEEHINRTPDLSDQSDKHLPKQSEKVAEHKPKPDRSQIVGRVVEGVEKEGDKIWVIKLSEYPTQHALRSGATAIVSSNPELLKYKAAIIRTRGNERLGLAFGTLSHKEATRICAMLQARGQSCTRIRMAS